MNWSELPHRYQGAEIGAVSLALAGTIMNWNQEVTATTASYLVNWVMGGLAFGYVTGAMADGLEVLASRKEQALLEKKVQPSSEKPSQSP
jgi:hypothetical protein